MTLRIRLAQRQGNFQLAVDLELPAHGITAISGASGSGKSTLLRSVAGLDRCREADIVINGSVWQDATTCLPVHARPVGYVPQQPALFAHLSVRRNLEYGLRRTPSAVRQVRWDDVVALLALAPLLDRQPQGLSGGEQQRVAVGRALLTSPRLLLLDEPLAALDAARKAEILPYLEELHARFDIPMLYVSHAADEIARLADHLVLLEEGRVLATGPLLETLARLDLPAAGEDAGVVLQAQVAERDERWHLARVAFDGGSLWVRDAGHALGTAVRVRVLARDVSISLSPAQDSSVLNSIAATVEQIADDAHPALARVRLRAGQSPLLARLTQRSCAALALTPGMAVWLQIKAVALIR